VGLERDPLSLVSTTEVLLGRNSSGSGLENREYVRRDTLPTSGGCSVGTVRSRTQAMEFRFLLYQNFIKGTVYTALNVMKNGND
jgi:hypothetical protein